MSYVRFPEYLPLLRLDGLEEEIQDVLVRTEMESGPAKVRRRFTAASVFIRGSFLLTQDELAVFDSFYRGPAGYGSRAFVWQHPRTLEEKVFRFVSPPRYSAQEGLFSVEMELEILPV